MRPLQVGIIGLGRSGRDIHGDVVSRLPELYQLAAVSDPMEERLRRAEQEWGCATYTDYRSLLKHEGLDLVVNASPSHLHVPISLEILESGLHALCEKPLAHRAEEVDLLIAASERTGRRMAVFHQSRYVPGYQQLLQVVRSGVLGRIVQASFRFNQFVRRWDWQTLQEKNGGNLLNAGSHLLDQALQLYGPGIQPDVFCRMDKANSFGDAEDYVKILLTHGSGPVVDLEISSCDAYAGYEYQVQGTRGGLVGTRSELNWRYYKPEEAPHRELVTEPISHADGSPAYCSERLIWHEESWSLPAEEESLIYPSIAAVYYRMLYEHLANGAPLEITLQEARRQLAVTEQCFRQNPDYAIGHRN
ncbi:Gfo/Idh/MocA family oxidoreductase [Paenibacillus rhizovicinus]|uniref:Gfo/Idh/MocA family oxidoreductase n=1 Tax=Paenibacillus rhizovicinus TaxID=2704463 RepID=A0A6C0P828_9BACL|nr:Gfo/Idh/MocA family oxidoreductase [Paenibacillus rhizovicinus]QHW34790.1 Gfo/Idh/MocA family oxidoreductase [Paenibacillus rhizovicinus]